MTDNYKKGNNYSFSLAGGTIALIAIRWVAYIIKELGYLPYEGIGILLTIILILGFALLVMSFDYLLYRIGIIKPIRSGLWFASMFGPVVGIAVYNEWNNPILGEAIGFACTILAFGLGYFLERLSRK